MPMDDSYRMRLKIGSHEFEADGPVDVVQEQAKRFMELIAALPAERVMPPLPAHREPNAAVDALLPPVPHRARLFLFPRLTWNSTRS